MKDKALRHSILIVAKSYLSRGDAAGEVVHKVLMGILDGVEIMDKVIGDDKPTRKSK